MIYCSVRKKAVAIVLAVVLLLLTLACGVFSALGWGWRGLWQMLMIVSIVAVIQIGQRYLLSGYEYLVSPLEDLLIDNRLTVVRIVGKRRTTEFVEHLNVLTEVIPYRKTKALTSEYGTPVRRMDFCPDLFPKESYLLLFEIHGELYTVRLQCDEHFAEELRKRRGV